MCMWRSDVCGRAGLALPHRDGGMLAVLGDERWVRKGAIRRRGGSRWLHGLPGNSLKKPLHTILLPSLSPNPLTWAVSSCEDHTAHKPPPPPCTSHVNVGPQLFSLQ